MRILINTIVLPEEEFPNKVLNSLWSVLINRFNKINGRLFNNHIPLGMIKNKINDLVQLENSIEDEHGSKLENKFVIIFIYVK